ncbi:hypothetical protein IO679_000790 [Salmonella enterica subsp. enterica serovar Glostrup]|nr:hypothetical protein [Salmonella enterica subsp. enterica serovar Glostrup]
MFQPHTVNVVLQSVLVMYWQISGPFSTGKNKLHLSRPDGLRNCRQQHIFQFDDAV